MDAQANFPTDREGCSYRACWNLFKKICAKKGLRDEDKALLFSVRACFAVFRLSENALDCAVHLSLLATSCAEGSGLWQGTARKVYRLPVPSAVKL